LGVVPAATPNVLPTTERRRPYEDWSRSLTGTFVPFEAKEHRSGIVGRAPQTEDRAMSATYLRSRR